MSATVLLLIIIVLLQLPVPVLLYKIYQKTGATAAQGGPKPEGRGGPKPEGRGYTIEE